MKTRPVNCHGLNSQCDLKSKPVTRTHCNLGPCAEWKVGDWQQVLLFAECQSPFFFCFCLSFNLQFSVTSNSKMWWHVLFSVRLHVAEDGDAALWNVLQEDYDAITELNLTCTTCVTWESVLCGKLGGGVRWVSIAPDILEPINFLQCHSYISKTRQSTNAAGVRAVACHQFSLLFPFPFERPQRRVSPMRPKLEFRHCCDGEGRTIVSSLKQLLIETWRT